MPLQLSKLQDIFFNLIATTLVVNATRGFLLIEFKLNICSLNIFLKKIAMKIKVFNIKDNEVIEVSNAILINKHLFLKSTCGDFLPGYSYEVHFFYGEHISLAYNNLCNVVLRQPTKSVADSKIQIFAKVGFFNLTRIRYIYGDLFYQKIKLKESIIITIVSTILTLLITTLISYFSKDVILDEKISTKLKPLSTQVDSIKFQLDRVYKESNYKSDSLHK